jgi:hypothetical protein
MLVVSWERGWRRVAEATMWERVFVLGGEKESGVGMDRW